MREAWIGAALVAVLALIAYPLSAQQSARPAGAHVVACSGIFAKDSDHLKLTTAFGSKNITFSDVEANDGSKVPASVLFPYDPKSRLEVWWSDPAARSDIHLIVIGGQSTWTAPGGMRLGQTLEQVEKLSHKPFKLKGFDKDSIATVSDWDGGALATLAGDCNAGLSLRADPKASAGAPTLGIVGKQYRSRNFAAVIGLDIGKSNVL